MEPNLSREQCEEAIKAFKTWLKICHENNREIGVDLDILNCNIDHSTLLRRLLIGGEPHEVPPPKRFSRPAWELVEEKEIEIVSLFEFEWDEGDISVSIDQSSEYKWVDKDNKIIQHTRLGIKYRYEEREVTPKASHLKKGLNPEDHRYIGKFLIRLE